MENYSSEPHREHTVAAEEVFQSLDGFRPVDSIDVILLLPPFELRDCLGDVDVALVVVVEFDQLTVDRPFQEIGPIKSQ